MRFAKCLAAMLTGMSLAASASVTTNIYAGFTTSGGGTPYSNFVGSLSTPGISFATDTGYNWHPFGLSGFGADVMADLIVATTGTYTFHLSSDDGSLVYVDGNLLIDRGGPHGPSTTDGTLFLTAGTHNVEIQFFECCGGPSGLDFAIPVGTTLVSPTVTVPEPGTLALAGTALIAALRIGRRRRG